MSNFQKYASLFIVVCVMILVTALCCKVSRKRGYSTGYQDALASIKPDTEYVDKPVYIDKPVPVEVKPAGQEFYPVGTVAQLKKVIDGKEVDILSGYVEDMLEGVLWEAPKED